MAKRSNEQIAKILEQRTTTAEKTKEISTTKTKIITIKEEKEEELLLLDKKITQAIEGFPPNVKFCELILRDRSRISKENALTICNYMIAMKREINPRLSYKRSTIQTLAEISKTVGISKLFSDMTRDDVLYYLDKCRKSENDDPLHKWIGSYNLKAVILSRFFKWLHYLGVEDPNKRNELSALEKKPDCIIGIKQLKRKEISCYKPSDLWSQQDDLLFLKWVTNKRDRCYHTMARDLSARPHEILNLKIKDIMFKSTPDNNNNNKKQYAEVLVNGKTGSRHIPLIQSIPYIKDWLSNHPSRNNPHAPLFVSLSKHSMGRKQLSLNGLYRIYSIYKEEFFPKLLEDKTLSSEDQEKIKNLLTKPFNPYVRRHSALTEKSSKLKSSTLNQHAGWSMNSHMAQKYIHYLGNESSESLLEAYGIVTNNKLIDTLNPKICPNCSEGNTQDARFCSKCKMIMSYDGYQEVLESEKKEKDELKTIKEQFSNMQSQIQSLISAFSNMQDQTQVDGMAKTLYGSGLIKPTTTVDKEENIKMITTSADSRLLIKKAGKAAYHAATSKSALTREAAKKQKVVKGKVF
jgi:integrase/recombinase XerD